MKPTIQKYIEYMRSVRNSSPHTLVNYGTDLDQFVAFLTPPGTETPKLGQVNHHMIREFVAHLHDTGLEKSSIARKLAALRSFFKYCVREGRLNENPARPVATPKLPKRVPAVLSAEEMNGFLDQLAGSEKAGERDGGRKRQPDTGGIALVERPGVSTGIQEDGLLLPRDRAILELLYAAGLRVSELTGLNLADMDQKDKMLRVRGKGNKERIVPHGEKAAEALKAYWPVRDSLLEASEDAGRGTTSAQAVFLNYRGRRLTQRSVGRIVKTCVKLVNVNWDLRTPSRRTASATHVRA